jgi:hypothetical protein
MTRFLALISASILAVPAVAAPTIDGTKDGQYGGARAVQTVNTQFSDNLDPLGFGNGGVLDAAYAMTENGRLYVMLTGNIEDNLNKLSVFIDSKPGGENVLSNGPQYDFNNVSQNFGGLKFDAGFTADYHLFGRWNGGAFQVDIVDREGGACTNDCGGDSGVANLGVGTAIQSGSVLGSGDGTTSYLSSPVQFGFNNTNIAGVVEGTGMANQAAALAVATGFEFSVALADIGSPTNGDIIRIHAVYGNQDNNFHSNQTLGGLPVGTDFLGGNGAGGFTGSLSGVDFTEFADEQYFSLTVRGELVPEPSCLYFAALAVSAFAVGRRRL